MAKEISENSLNEIVGGMNRKTFDKVVLGAGLASLGIVGIGGGGYLLYKTGQNRGMEDGINFAFSTERDGDSCDANGKPIYKYKYSTPEQAMEDYKNQK